MPPPGPAHPHAPHPEPAPPQPPQGKAGFLNNGQLCVGAGDANVDAGGKCAHGGFSASTLSAKSSVWQQMPTGFKLVSEAGDHCLNLYGGGKAGTCKNGTAIHASTCRWSAKGDCWLATKDGQLKLDVAKGSACAGTCAKADKSGCLVAAVCGGAGTAGWEIAPAGGS